MEIVNARSLNVLHNKALLLEKKVKYFVYSSAIGIIFVENKSICFNEDTIDFSSLFSFRFLKLKPCFSRIYSGIYSENQWIFTKM